MVVTIQLYSVLHDYLYIVQSIPSTAVTHGSTTTLCIYIPALAPMRYDINLYCIIHRPIIHHGDTTTILYIYGVKLSAPMVIL